MRTDGLPTAHDLGMNTPDWYLDANCAGLLDDQTWFPPKGGTTRPAKAICARCPVRLDCLTFALAHGERFGVWGGLSERERRKLEQRGGRVNLRATSVEEPAQPIVCCALDNCRQPFTSLRGFHTHRSWRHTDARRAVPA